LENDVLEIPALKSPRSPRRTDWIRMTDVARQAGVSTMTVSRVYKQPDRVSAKTRQRVLAIAERLGYVPNLVAANLSSGRGNVIAAIVPSFSNSYFAATLQGMADELRRNGYEMMLADS